ncbi:hypothetical protein KY348_06125 [Candidatus Woesearchaeota archaeon]|nr:hypothetical protein [Candidatus Woesearchaeota archaeon]
MMFDKTLNKVVDWLYERLEQKKESLKQEKKEFRYPDEYVFEEDKKILDPLLSALEEYGFRYEIRGGHKSKEKSPYRISIKTVNEAKAFKSPAFWNSIVEQRDGEIIPKVPSDFGSCLPSGLGLYERKIASSKLLEQIALSFAKKGSITGKHPLVSGEINTFTYYEFPMSSTEYTPTMTKTRIVKVRLENYV